MSKMEKRYTKKDFYVGQEVYAECIGTVGSMLEKGSISTETVTKIGSKYVTTNKRIYRITDGIESTDYTADFVLWIDKNELETKVAKDNVFTKLVDLFGIGYGGLQNQKLYKKLSLEDLQKIEQIIDKAMEE
jgi:hypothetical protein